MGIFDYDLLGVLLYGRRATVHRFNVLETKERNLNKFEVEINRKKE